ncbi:glycogen synthase GlgA [Olsenella sp. Marseille-QA0557]|mgnify:CR=1 FL=1|uniref:glycogen synthase GlgA n=1 Tax=Olsenella sp. Marseille-QA0557 TaxID=3378782 RepID=UPI003D0EA54A
MAEKKRRKLRVVFASSEVVPFAKTGGLGDVGGSLPPALRRAGCKIAVILPKYATIPEEYRSRMDHVCEFYVPLGWRSVYCGIEHLVYRDIDFYFVDNEYYFARDGLYGYFDDGERFAYFSKALLEAMQYVEDLQCDILHCNDWQTAMAPVFLREFYHGDIYDNVRTIFTIHNVKFQGQYSDFVLKDILGLADVPAAVDQLYVGPQTINYMRGAVRYSDLLTTVSPTYAQELKMPFYGEGLEYEFQRRGDALKGVLNGIDMAEYNPKSDPEIFANFSVDDLSGKAECKAALQEELGLRVDPERPLVVMVGRLTKQKGLDLVQYAIDRIMSRGVQLAVLGTGDKEYEDSMRYFDWRYSDMMCARITFDSALAQRMYSGADLFLMPSQFEPCGLSQMIAMRYGTLPVVRETGGLVDTVNPYNKYTGEGDGFRFANFNADEMCDTLLNACEVFWTQPDVWKELQRHAMEKDFGWHRAADDYVDIYHTLHPEVIRYIKRRDR